MHFFSTISTAGAVLLAFSSTVSADGVYGFIGPNTPTPPGCVTSYTERFGFQAYVLPAPTTVAPRFPKMYVPETATTLTMRLVNGVLFDRQGRIGSIVANRQFQFDGPPAQAGAIYTAGWSVCPDENVLALGDQKLFWQCASGNFNNLYDQKIAEQCNPIFLKIVHFQ